MDLFAQAVHRRDSLSVKWNRKAIRSICGNPDAQPFWVADMDYPAPPVVLEALQEQIHHGVLGYPTFSDHVSVFTAWAAKRHNWTMEKANVVIAPGMLASVATLIELLSRPGDAVILPMPAYQPFVHIIQDLNRKLIPWPMAYDQDTHHFSLDVSALEQLAHQHHSPLLVFCSPHNPTGRVFSFEELSAVAEVAKNCNLAVISDEIHADLTLAHHTHIPFDIIARTHDVVSATCMAPSKTFNIAGEHYSVTVCSTTDLAKRLQYRFQALHLSPDLLSSVSALSAYRGGYFWLMELLEHLDHQITMINQLFTESSSDLHLVTPEASFIAFIDCSSAIDLITKEVQAHPEVYGSASLGILSRFFGHRAGIAMNDGTWFGSDYQNFVRFNYGTTEQAVRDAIGSIITATEELTR
jgi:cystathionine beta-lyase